MFSGTSTFVEGVDTAFFFIIGISLIFLIGITAIMLYFVFRYNKTKNAKSTYIEGSTKLEIIWTVVPTILVVLMFWYGYKAYAPMRDAPEGAMQVKVNARMWNFSFQYANGKVSDTLFVPVDEPVYVDMVSADVIHSFYIPAFRVKEDIVPGKKNYVWFEASKVGKYDLFCTEYCGMRHSYMITAVRVMEKADFEEWLGDDPIAEAAATMSPEEKAVLLGQQVMQANACFSCHSIDGARIVGPTFSGLFGKTETVVLENGSEKEITVDEEYITRSIRQPNAEITKGFSKGLMQDIYGEDKLSQEDLDNIIAYLKSLND